MPAFFSIGPEHLRALDAAGAVRSFRMLLSAEAATSNIPISKISVTENINVADGGVDARVDATGITFTPDLVKHGVTSYQIKTGTSFEPWQKAKVKNELFGNKPETKESLGLAVKECMDKNGTYVVVLFGQDPTSDQEQNAVANFVEKFKVAGYADPKVEVWGQHKLLMYLEKYPSQKMRLNGTIGGTLKPHESWSMQSDMRQTFVPGKPQEEFMAGIQKNLRDGGSASPLRVRGEAGIGKTRLVFEAVKTEDLSPTVIYAESPDALHQSGLLGNIILPDSKITATLIVDECEAEQSFRLWNQLKHCSPRIKLITIFNEFDPPTGEEVRLDVPGLSELELTKIIESYGIANDQARRFAQLCEDSPRVAHVLGQNLKDNPEDPLRMPSDVDVWNRFIKGRGETDMVVERRMKVLRYISLFKRFGFKKPVEIECRAVHGIIQAAYPEITWEVFQQIITDELKPRKILQGDGTLYLTPRALHIWLWKEWWRIHGNGFDFKKFVEQLPGKLKDWYFEMFKYAAGSEVASETVKDLLSDDGPFADGEFLKTESGGRFFLGLTEANPEAAVKRLEKTIGVWPIERLKTLGYGKNSIVWSLERIAVWEPLFLRASKILLRLAAVEGTDSQSHPLSIFSGLFMLGHGDLAPSEASPEARFPLLEEALRSKDAMERMVALKALDSALDLHPSRALGAENQGLKRKPKLWTPKLWKEVHDAFRRAWGILRSSIDFLEGDERQKAIHMLLNHAQGLGRMVVLSDMVADTLTELSTKPYIEDKNQIVVPVERVLNFGRKELPKESLEKWQKLKNDLVGKDFSSQLRRYVGLTLLEDNFDEDRKRTNGLQNKLSELSKEALADPSLLFPELPWLSTAQARNGYTFAYALGQGDVDFKLYPKIIEAHTNMSKMSVFFLSGYMRAMYEKDRNRYESEINKLAADAFWQKFVPELIWRAGVTDHLAQVILSLITSSKIEVSTLGFFVYGAAVREMSEPVFIKWIEALLSSGKKQEVGAALNLFDTYYLKDDKTHIPVELTLRLLLHEALFTESHEGYPRDGMEDYNWAEIAKRLLKVAPDKTLPIAEKLISHMGERGTIAGTRDKYVAEILNEITKLHSKEVWKFVVSNLDTKAFHLIKEWLGDRTIFTEDSFGKMNEVFYLFPLDDLWSWIEKDIEERAWHIAAITPKDLVTSSGKPSLVRELLVRYGDRDDVRRNLMANFSSEGWSGPASLHYEKKKKRLEDFRKSETNPRVVSWLNDYISVVEDQIKRAKIEEERDEF